MSKKKIEISSITVTIGDTSIEATIDELKTLYRALGELFEDKTKHVPCPVYPYWPWDKPTITWATSSGTDIKFHYHPYTLDTTAQGNDVT
ncbi:hypothetical protein KDA14_04295 [Candidatus Saccharibacteria bacterium]|nr:hypothetical protein [Candidatus Saccharibacteria bacterium]